MAPVRLYYPDEATRDQVDELRSLFLQEAQKDDLRDHVHPADLHRARVDNFWLRRFLAHGDLEMQKSLDYMVGSVKFRHEWGINDLTLDGFLREVPMAFDKGQISVHTRDVDGAPVMVFHTALHQRLTGDDWRRGQLCLIYWVERLERVGRGQPITLMLDLSGAGLHNVDIPFIQFLIGMFKTYYPAMLNAIIVYELPWILNAVWRLIKQMLPPKAHLIMKFISKKDIRKVVPEENVLERWGGTCKWKWHYRREDHEMPPSPFLDEHQDSSAEEDEPMGDINRNVSKILQSQCTQDSDSHDTVSVGASSQASDLRQDSPSVAQRHSSVLHTQSSPNLLADTPPPPDRTQKFESSKLAVPRASKQPEDDNTSKNRMKRSATSGQFASKVGGPHAPVVPVRRRASKKGSVGYKPHSAHAPTMTHYQSIVDLPGSSAKADKQPMKAISESGDSGAYCDDFSDRSHNSTEENTTMLGDLLSISPGHEVKFSTETAVSCQPMTIRCTHHTPVAFKVKTTAPDRFLVRPSRGVVAPGRSACVELHLAAGITAQMAVTERFLLVATPVSNAPMTDDQLDHHWKNAPASSLLNHRLRCSLALARQLPSSVARNLTQQLERVQQQLTQQQRLTDRLAQQAAASHRWLAATAAALTALAVANCYMLFSGVAGC